MTDVEAPIDYSELEAKYATEQETRLDRFVVVDGAPIAPEAKVEALTKVLKKVFNKTAPIVEPHGFFMPLDESGKTQGFVFLEFATEADARNIVKTFNNKKLDAKHTLHVDRLSNVEQLTSGSAPTAFKEPEVPAFKPLPHLRSWLTDPYGRDQAVMHVADTVGVYWFNKDAAPKEAFSRERMTETYVRWSPEGSYLASMHHQGVALHAGAHFDLIGRFPHKDARFVDFSPDEKYLVTASTDPIPGPPSDEKQRAQWPFKESDEGNHIVIWSIATGAPLRTFPMVPIKPTVDPAHQNIPPQSAAAVVLAADKEKQAWPAFKWSSDSKYFARIAAKDTLAIYETPSMGLCDKKPVKINGIQDFEFSPAAVGGRQLLVYWTPEMPNQTARVCLMDAATRTTVRNRSLFNVANCVIHWQDEAKYLCIKVDRLTKNKKSIVTSLEIYRLTDKTMPVEVIELKEIVLRFAWEPKSDRFVTISYLDVPNQQMSSTKNILSFYALERNKGLQGTWKEANRLEGRTTNSIHWSPQGRFLMTAVKSTKPVLEFWDVEHEGSTTTPATADKTKELNINVCFLANGEHLGMTDVAWDSSGRVLATASSQWRNSTSPGFKLWDIKGQLLREEGIPKLKAFLWRPRPASILPADKKKEVQKNLKKYSTQFDMEDAARASEESTELQEKRTTAINAWASWRADTAARLGKLGLVPEELQVQFVDGKIVVYQREVLEETEEVEV